MKIIIVIVILSLCCTKNNVFVTREETHTLHFHDGKIERELRLSANQRGVNWKVTVILFFESWELWIL